MNFDQLLLQTDSSLSNRLKTVKETNSEVINELINNNEKAITDEFVDALVETIEQLLSHYNQLLIKSQDISLDSYNNLSNQNLMLEFTKLKANENDQEKIDKLEELYKRILEQYNVVVIKIKEDLSNKDNNIEINNLVLKINENLDKINKLKLSNDTLTELINIYKNVCNKINYEANIKLLLKKTDEILSLSTTNNNIDEGSIDNNTSERVFDLFAKINDQIVSSVFKKDNDLVYANYTLEDNSKYYAIVRKEEDILILDQRFLKLSNLELTKDNIIKTCETIISNAIIYYNINEFMRYIEMGYKSKITKEIDEAILKYKKRLSILEKALKSQLEFIDSIAPLINHRPSPKYPNIVYNDVDLNQYFQNDDNIDNKTKEKRRLITNVLLNDQVNSSFNTKSLLTIMYDDNTLNKLFDNNGYNKIDKPNVNLQESISKPEVNTNITTNYEMIANYLNSRIQELNLLINSPKINVTISKDDNPLYKEVNTVMDLHTALVICDKVYKKGQGLFAVTDYLRTGQINKFTSQYGARTLVSTIDRKIYLKLLLENIIKEFTLSSSKANDPEYCKKMSGVFTFISTELSKENITIKELVTDLLNNSSVLETAIINFNYDYLNKLSLASKTLNLSLEKAKEANNASAIKIINVLMELKKIV